MVARLRGRPSPRPPGPPEVEEDNGAKAPRRGQGNQRIMMAVTAVSLVAAVAATGTLFWLNGPGRVPVNQAELPFQSTGPLTDLGPFIVNLGDVNDRRYLRIALSLDYQTQDPAFASGNEGSRAAWISQFKGRLKDYEPVFKDVVVTTLSSKTAAQLGTAAGKESLKVDLMGRLNNAISSELKGTSVRDVYFTDFVIQ